MLLYFLEADGRGSTRGYAQNFFALRVYSAFLSAFIHFYHLNL